MPDEPRLRLAKRIPRTESEGPGARFAVWVQGCTIRCVSCCNPEMFHAHGGDEVSVQALADEIRRTPRIEGVTFLGGEPFEQAAGLAALALRVHDMGLSVMTFTGFVHEDLVARGQDEQLALLAHTDLLADGPFDVSRPGSKWRWLGSQNQRLIHLTDRYSPDDPRLTAENTVDITIGPNGIQVSGWPSLANALVRDLVRKRGEGV